MGSTLTWRPLQSDKALSNGLKWALREKYGEPVWQHLTPLDIPYLATLAKHGVDGADTLIKAIEQYDTIVVKEEY